MPTQALLAPYPRLQRHFTPLATCIKRGDLAGFDAALHAGEAEFVKRRIYLTLERGRDIALRNLLRKVFIAGGFEPAKEGEERKVRRTRVPIAEFAAAIRLGSGGVGIDMDEVECMVANCIYKVSRASRAFDRTHLQLLVASSVEALLPAEVAGCLTRSGAAACYGGPIHDHQLEARNM